MICTLYVLCFIYVCMCYKNLIPSVHIYIHTDGCVYIYIYKCVRCVVRSIGAPSTVACFRPVCWSSCRVIIKRRHRVRPHSHHRHRTVVSVDITAAAAAAAATAFAAVTSATSAARTAIPSPLHPSTPPTASTTPRTLHTSTLLHVATNAEIRTHNRPRGTMFIALPRVLFNGRRTRCSTLLCHPLPPPSHGYYKSNFRKK